MRGTEIAERLAAEGRTKAALARHLGRSVHSIGRLTASARELPASEAQQVENFFNGAAPETPMTRIPVYGYAAAGGDERVSLAANDVLDELELPVGLIRGEAFGVRVAGDSMEPRLFSGETVIVARKMAPARYGDCVVELRDGTALVKQYRGQRDGKVYLAQFNPPLEFHVEGASVRAVHAVVLRR
jgi:phage repressor protein C with HTH and peptisase S24 domain